MTTPSPLRSRLPLAAAVVAAAPALCGFVLLSNQEAKLPVSPTSPTQNFVWDGKAPKSIQDKDKYKGGLYANLSDVAMMQQLLTDAMGLWNNIPGAYVQLAFQDGNAVDDAKDGQSSILVLADKNLSTAAFAVPTFDEHDPKVISDCDVHINNSATPAADLAFTIAHELGHCLGLGHAHSNYGSIMGYSRAARTMTLGPDDQAGIIYLYPDPAFVDGKPKELACGVVAAGRGGSATAAAGSAALASWALLAPLAAALVGGVGLVPWRRRR